MSAISIGVVGGGASAVCLIDALVMAKGGPGSLTVFEPSPNLWRGRAYQVDSETIKVNATPDDMSVRAGDPHHFIRWLGARERMLGESYGLDPFSGARFAPRTVYGEYLEQTAYAGLAELRRQGWRVDLVGDSVTSARRTEDQVVVSTGRGMTSSFDYVVLCVGGDGPKDVYGLAGSPGFIADPYPVSQNLRTIGAAERVAVIGSGLTAVDIVLSLAAQGHRGPISLVSRRGVLPGVRQREAHFELRHLTQERMRALARSRREISVQEFTAVVQRELHEAGVDMPALHAELASLDGEPPADRLRRQFAAVNASDLGLRILQRAVPEIGPDVWPVLGEQDRAEVLRLHYRTVMSLCCPMPPSSAAVLLGLIDEGRLDIRSGLDSAAAGRGGGLTLSLLNGTVLRTDRVINAVSASEGRIPQGAAPLVNTLIGDRAASLHPHGGLHVLRATSQLTTDGASDPRLYGLGTIAAGSLFFTFGVQSLVDRGVDIVDAILEHAAARTASHTAESLLPA
ncbi:FAD/NAD(P)-binding protein [Streptomyces sp. FL06-04B]|uniref:FAD/NAD(P)-binding protein n=1 Tax=unclassified Streptomyces TaxID=2593676 RepID=UPI0029B07174|nr:MULTISPECIES: FAD/NAD(P)-binding protein [unclassified Streptomyces]MDX3608866.1 FAD/NAD(P)-binding protein [Streptomyces sp. FL06-04B]MDX3739105.1 FAD/NAD(P)-binding protein [Streptomyces sp. ID01-15D]